jgi:hypothetical protein
MVRQRVETIIGQHPKINSYLSVVGGLTLKELDEVMRLTMVRDKSLTPAGIVATRRRTSQGLQGLAQVETHNPGYLPPTELSEWLEREKLFFLAANMDPALVPKGLVLDGGPGVGKCLAPDEPVLMFNGSIIKTKDLKVGDLMMGPDSKPRRVMSTTPGYGPMFEVRPIKGRAFRCNGDHILSLKRSRSPNSGEVVFAPVRDWMTWPDKKKSDHKLWRAPVDFPPRSVPVVDPYFIGIVIGDGGVTDTIKVTTIDPEIVDAIRDVSLRHGLGLSNWTYGDRASTYGLSGGNVGGGCNLLLTKLLKYGLDVPCNRKFIPDDFKFGSRDVRLQVLAGLIDTDGSLTINGSFDFISKSQTLSEDVAFVARSLGLAAYVNECSKTCTNNGAIGTYWRVGISGDTSIVPCRLPRKQAKARRQIKDVLRTGFDVVPIGDGAWFGITLDGDHQYLLGDFTVTHNTEAAKWIAYMLGLPLYRIDLGTTKNMWVGQSEANLSAILSRLDREEPCVALFDEIEKMVSEDSSGVGASMMSQLLWWFAESPSRVLRIMTTNDLKRVPAELYRPGRIDKVMNFGGLKGEAAVLKFANHVMAQFPPKLRVPPPAMATALKALLMIGETPVSQATVTQAVKVIVKQNAIQTKLIAAA